MYIRLISKGVYTYLLHKGFMNGRKTDITIPAWVIQNRVYMLNFLRGYIDTDGSIHFRGNYPIISFSSKSEQLIKPIFDFVKNQGFSISNYYKEQQTDKRNNKLSICYSIKINGKNNLQLWKKLIYFKNSRHLKKVVGNGDAGI